MQASYQKKDRSLCRLSCRHGAGGNIFWIYISKEHGISDSNMRRI